MTDATIHSDPPSGDVTAEDKRLFWACLIALVATAFGFIVRAQIIGDWGVQFNLSETQKGEILGVGLWPFAISIILFSLVIDRIGYGTAMVFAFVCHVLSVIITIFATGYWMLYIGTFIVALGNGTIEAVINPVVATMFSKEKTKWLNILHSGWPGGLFLGGVLALAIGVDVDWRWKIGLIMIPTIIYGFMMLGRKFPIHERVKAGVSYKVMLQEAGVLGAVIIVALMVSEIGRVFAWSLTLQIVVAAALIIGYGAYVKTVGRPMFIILLLIMIPLATTELGTDSWITDLVTPVMANIGVQAGWLLVYTAFIMMILRFFFAGALVRMFSPLGLLALGSAIAVFGLIFMSKSTGIVIFVAATVYALGKTFFWPTMLGVVAERFPKGGALTLNTIGGMGMLSVGVIGVAFLGNIQDKEIDRELLSQNPAIHAEVVGGEQVSVFGAYRPLDHDKIAALDAGDQSLIGAITDTAKKNALATVAIFPAIMLVCYLALIYYFRSRGGYKAEVLTAEGEM